MTRYRPHYLYADGDWSGSDDFLRTKVSAVTRTFYTVGRSERYGL